MDFPPYVSKRIQFNFKYVATPNTSLIDEWFKKFLQIAKPTTSELLPPFLQHDKCACYVARIVTLGQTLLQQWHLPVFEHATLVKITPTLLANTLRCELAQPSLAHLPPIIFQNSYTLCASFCEWSSQHPISDESITAFFGRLEALLFGNRPPMELGGKSTVPVLKEAYKLQIPFFHLGNGIYQLGTGSASRYLMLSRSDKDSFIGSKLSGNKRLTSSILRSRGLPVPSHFVARTREAAQVAASELGYPLVVKPSDAERGEGVTVGIDSQLTLVAAFGRAQKCSRSGEVLIEKQVAGICHRLFIVSGKLLYCVKRLPLYVIGDGVRTLDMLIEAYSREDRLVPPWLRQNYCKIDVAAKSDLIARGFVLASVPSKGERVYVRAIETTEWGGIDEDVTEFVHSENVRAAVTAARALDLEIAGVDIITADISKPLRENGGIISEVNASPLLGGGDVSRAALPAFFRIYLGTNCQIPIEEYDVGVLGSDVVRDRCRALEAVGVRTWIVAEEFVIGSRGQKIPFSSFLDGSEIEGGKLATAAHRIDTRTVMRQLVRNRGVDHVIIARGYQD